MKYTKRILTVLVMALLVVALALLANAEGTTIVDSGQCGENLAWTLDSEGTLKISGTGEMNGRFEYREDIISVVIEDGITSINGGAFAGCRHLSSVSIGKGVNTIYYRAFYNCTALTSIVIPDSTVWIGESCFRNCFRLKEVELNEGLIVIEEGAFNNCAIEKIHIPKSLLFIGDTNEKLGTFTDYIVSQGFHFETYEDFAPWVDTYYKMFFTNPCHSVFEGCFALSSISVEPENMFFTSIDGCLYSKDKTILIKYPEAKKGSTFSVPTHVKTINAYAFYGNNYLEEVIVQDNVETVFEYAFVDCINLKKIFFLNPFIAFLGPYYGEVPNVISRYVTTIYGYSGSTAETVSLLNNCRFEVINDSNLPGSGTTSEPTTQPTTKPTTQPATEADEQSTDEETEETLNFFQRIIQWFKNLFAKLFGR